MVCVDLRAELFVVSRESLALASLKRGAERNKGCSGYESAWVDLEKTRVRRTHHSLLNHCSSA